MSNKYLEKVAESKELSSGQKKAVGGTAALGGASLVSNEYHRGNLTGRETLYHGTSHAYKDEILRQGLKPKAKKGVIDAAESALGKSLESDHLTFMTKSKAQAHMYSNQSDRIRKGTFNILDEVGRLKDKIPSKNSRKGIVTINAPTWKKDEFTKVRNPELKSQFKSVNNSFYTRAHKKMMKSKIHTTLEKEVFTNKGPVSNKYMKGSSAYTKNSFKEIGQFIKNNPMRFAKGTSKAALGASLIASGAYLARSGFKDGK